MTSNVWDKSVEVEGNFYNWLEAPVVIDRIEPLSSSGISHIDLFSGCGGFSTGFEMSGMETSIALDIHPPSLETLRLNHPRTRTVLGDIRRVDEHEFASLCESDSSATVLTAGVPCQGFSLSNRKRHAEDKRNYLFQEFIRIAELIRPEAVVLENVSGLTSTKNGDFKRDITAAIEELGFDVHFAQLNAAEYGVPQIRKRVFFVGVPKGANWKFPAPEFGNGLSPFRTVRDAILGDLPELEAGQSASHYLGEPVCDLQTWLRADGASNLLNHEAPAHPQETIERIRRTEPGMPMYESFTQRIRLHPDRPSPTQICGGIRPQFQFGHPTQARGLTIRERARIQTFPDSYEFCGGITQGRVQTGNAVPPLLAAAIASQIRKMLNGEQLEGVSPDAAVASLF
jgi:DNA (cytosine-5)-methyltransferase 1